MQEAVSVPSRFGVQRIGRSFWVFCRSAFSARRDAGQDEAADVLAVALDHVEGDGGAAADDAERFVGEAARTEHGEVAVGAEGMGFAVGDGEGVVGFFLRDEGLQRFTPEVINDGSDFGFDAGVIDAADGDAARFGQQVPGAPQFGAPVFFVGGGFDDAGDGVAVKPFDAGNCPRR